MEVSTDPPNDWITVGKKGCYGPVKDIRHTAGSSSSEEATKKYVPKLPKTPTTNTKFVGTSYKKPATSYKGKKKAVISIPDFESPEEQVKFTQLQKDIPHIMMPGIIRRKQQLLNIDNLADRILSEESIEFQRNGWEFVRVVKPNDEEEIPETEDYDLMSLDNKWGDYVLFKKVS